MTSTKTDPLTDYRLIRESGRLNLVNVSSKGDSGIFVEMPVFLSRPRDRSELGSQPLIRAIGKGVVTIVDATAGLAQDSMLLATYGFQVTACERSPLIIALLEDGLARIQADTMVEPAIRSNLRFISGDAIELLPTLDPKPDAVYLDPMYPEKKKAALPKKELQVLRKVVGPDADAEKLFDAAMSSAAKRVIVKRPHHAPPLRQSPSMSYQGKLVRFDVYLVRN
jgi:16S rRNA (guanine1516-N2)-methyltransferase